VLVASPADVPWGGVFWGAMGYRGRGQVSGWGRGQHLRPAKESQFFSLRKIKKLSLKNGYNKLSH